MPFRSTVSARQTANLTGSILKTERKTKRSKNTQYQNWNYNPHSPKVSTSAPRCSVSPPWRRWGEMVFSGCVISCSVEVATCAVVRFSFLRLSEGRPIIPAAVSVISVWPSFFFFFFFFFFIRQQQIISVIIQFSHGLFTGKSTHQREDLNSRLTDEMLVHMQIIDIFALVCVSGCTVAFQNVSHHVDITCSQPDCQGTAVQLQARSSPSYWLQFETAFFI